MNRKDWKRKSDEHIRSARFLMAKRQFSSAYYLAGLAVECKLKACIARNFKKEEWPDKELVNRIHTHKLKTLLDAAGLTADMAAACAASANFAAYWKTLQAWEIDSRYRQWAEPEARDMLEAAGKRAAGVLSWLSQYC